jgi:hypothetical protein
MIHRKRRDEKKRFIDILTSAMIFFLLLWGKP